jgi:hypothetical protein
LFRRYVDQVWRIATDHFDGGMAQRAKQRSRATPIEDVLVERSTYPRGALKRRLFDLGLKQRVCELCGQGEVWHGQRLSLILDHINGTPDDDRIANLRIVCPNCAATFDTHCGRKNRQPAELLRCGRCGCEFVPGRPEQRYCSRACGCRHPNRRRGPRPSSWRVPRPPREVLLAEIAASSVLAVGRKYGVTDNAIRKWVRAYEQTERDDRDRGPT